MLVWPSSLRMNWRQRQNCDLYVRRVTEIRQPWCFLSFSQSGTNTWSFWMATERESLQLSSEQKFTYGVLCSRNCIVWKQNSSMSCHTNLLCQAFKGQHRDCTFQMATSLCDSVPAKKHYSGMWSHWWLKSCCKGKHLASRHAGSKTLYVADYNIEKERGVWDGIPLKEKKNLHTDRMRR